jgi:glycerol-3-phosphate acyltransferase PlsY
LIDAPGITIPISYLLGSIPFGYLLVRIFRGQDIRATGSGNIGATNVARSGSKGLAVTTLLLDALKGFIAVEIAFHMNGANGHFAPEATLLEMPNTLKAVQIAYLGGAVAAFCAMLGHMFPVWLRFKGGKGVATAVGAYVAISPKALGVVLILFVVTVAVTRYVSLGSMLGAAIFPFLAWWLSRGLLTTGAIAFIAACSALITIRHKDNIRRLLAGTENRFR